METKLGSSAIKKEKKPAMGFARTKKEVKTPSPHILQSCVGLGCKFIFEKKVRMVLKVRQSSFYYTIFLFLRH